MISEKALVEQFNLLPIPTDKAQVRFDPPDSTHYRDGSGHPSMYMLNAALTTYFYCTELHCFISIDISEDISYNFTWWFNDNKFCFSVVDMQEICDDETVNVRDTVRFGIFHPSEEEHFQSECLKGNPLSWSTEQLVRQKLAAISEFYMDQYYADFLKGSE